MLQSDQFLLQSPVQESHVCNKMLTPLTTAHSRRRARPRLKLHHRSVLDNRPVVRKRCLPYSLAHRIRRLDVAALHHEEIQLGIIPMLLRLGGTNYSVSCALGLDFGTYHVYNVGDGW